MEDRNNLRKYSRYSDTELQQKVLSNFILFFVLLAVVTGLVITCVALSVYGDKHQLTIILPMIIIAISIIPIYNTWRKASFQKKILKMRQLNKVH